MTGSLRWVQGLECVYPESKPLGHIIVTAADLKTLEGETYVNDTIVDYYYKVARYHKWYENGSTQSKVHFFNAFFFTKLTWKGGHTEEESDEDKYERVRMWTKDVDIFAQDFLFIPIHSGMHWSLAVVCHPGNLENFSSCDINQHWSALIRDGKTVDDVEAQTELARPPCTSIIHLDSLAPDGHDTTVISENLRIWLKEEWKRTHSQVSPGALSHVASKKLDKIPKQTNNHDCALYTLTYTEFLAYRTPSHVHLLPSRGRTRSVYTWYRPGCQPFPNVLTADWFDGANGSHLRHALSFDLVNLILRQNFRGLIDMSDKQTILQRRAIRMLRVYMYTRSYAGPEQVAANHTSIIPLMGLRNEQRPEAYRR